MRPAFHVTWTDIVVAVSSGLVAAVALYGLFTWRKQMTGKAKFDVARNVAFLARKVAQDFESARYPLSLSTEAGGRAKGQNESQRESEILDQWYLQLRRLDILRNDLSKLEATAWEAEIVLGETAGEVVTQAVGVYKDCFGELASAIEFYFEDELKQAKGSGTNIDPKWLDDLRKIVYSRKGDVLSTKIDEALKRLNSALRQHLK